MSDADPTRRDVLKRGAALGVASVAPAGTAAADVPEDETAGTALPAPFDEMPTVDDPTDFERRIAGVNFPPEAVPDEGPVPDVHHQHVVEAEITVPAWALEAARWRLRHNDPDEVDRWRVEEILMEYAYTRERFLTPDGRDAVDVLLENPRSEGGQADE